MSLWGLRFPAHDRTLWIVRAAYARQFPRSLAELGRTLGLSRSQASRTVQRLVDEGLLVDQGDSYDFNDDHPFAGEIGRWLYLATGAKRPQPSRFYEHSRPRAERLEASRSLPEHWRTLDIASARDEPTRSALQARQAATALAEARRELRQIEAIAHEVYSDVKAERARDFIHLLGGLGDDANLAEWLLRQHAKRQDIARQQSPLEPVVYEVEWERIGFLLEAQVASYEDAADLVTRAYTAGHDANRKRLHIAEEMATYPVYNANVQGHIIEEVTQQAREVKDLRESALEQHLYWHGGMPGFHEVGTLGDLLVKHALLRARDNTQAVQQRYGFPSDTAPTSADDAAQLS